MSRIGRTGMVRLKLGTGISRGL